MLLAIFVQLFLKCTTHFYVIFALVCFVFIFLSSLHVAVTNFVSVLYLVFVSVIINKLVQFLLTIFFVSMNNKKQQFFYFVINVDKLILFPLMNFFVIINDNNSSCNQRNTLFALCFCSKATFDMLST